MTTICRHDFFVMNACEKLFVDSIVTELIFAEENNCYCIDIDLDLIYVYVQNIYTFHTLYINYEGITSVP